MKTSSFSIVRLVPMMIVMGAIFFLSHQPGDDLDIPDIEHLDKIGHFVIYGLLALTVIWAPPQEVKKRRPWMVITITLVICILYGVSDEFHQSFIPGRFMSVGDLLADLSGIIFVCVIWAKKNSY